MKSYVQKYENFLNENINSIPRPELLNLIKKYNDFDSYRIKDLIIDIEKLFPHRIKTRNQGELIDYIEDTTEDNDRLPETPAVAAKINTILNESISEGRKSIVLKRKYTEKYPEKRAGVYAPIRETILRFVQENGGKVSRKELKEYVQSKNEEEGINIKMSWIPKNKKYLKRKKTNEGIFYKITSLGKRYLKSKEI